MHAVIAAIFACLALTVFAATPAAELTVGLASELQSVDPHRALTQADATVAAHAFETLVALDSRSKPVPMLATEWAREDDKTWRLTLRPSVRFHDGGELNADDVVLSIERALKLRPELAIAGDPEWLSVVIVDPFTLRLRTKAAYPLLLRDLSALRIASAASIRASETANAGGASLAGTGPYRITERFADGVKLVAHERYWGTRPVWRSVVFRPLPNPTQRIDALLAAKVDLIERAAPRDIERLRGDARFEVHQAPSGRLMYLQLGTHRVNPPYLSYRNQTVASPNPLLDRRVRRAISESIDRRALVSAILHGLGEPAGQLVPQGFFGHVPGLYADARNVEDARALLAEAGYPDGFALTLHGPSGVYPEDTEVLAAIARMLRDADIRAEAIAESSGTFANRAARQQYSAYLRGFTASTRDASVPLRALLATYDPGTGAGSLNWARYSDGTLDDLIQRALGQRNDESREFLLQEATRLAMKEHALVPLYFEHEAWAMRSGLAFTVGPDGLTAAERAKPAP